MVRRFPLGTEFPTEGFVQKSIGTYFASLGYDLLDEGYTDLACVAPETGERWVIEAKGHSTSVGLDFNTCLGQLLKRMHDDETARFGLALPDISPYRRQICLVSSRVRQALGLHWILVARDGSVSIIGPEDGLDRHR